jgi:hypothetical protein
MTTKGAFWLNTARSCHHNSSDDSSGRSFSSANSAKRSHIVAIFRNSALSLEFLLRWYMIMHSAAYRR